VIGVARRRKLLSAWLVVLSYSSVIFYFSSQSEPVDLPFSVFPGLDKVIHAFEFGLLSVLLYWALGCSFWAASARLKGISAVMIS